MTNPLVSIVIPVCSGANYLRYAIDTPHIKVLKFMLLSRQMKLLNC
ncbi:MAG: hypothetical protein FWH22_11700 [Fibromonadales bacterium]|nr:hypothetical protein [Fibromonadales bacterium]